MLDDFGFLSSPSWTCWTLSPSVSARLELVPPPPAAASTDDGTNSTKGEKIITGTERPGRAVPQPLSLSLSFTQEMNKDFLGGVTKVGQINALLAAKPWGRWSGEVRASLDKARKR